MQFKTETQIEWDTVWYGDTISLKLATILYQLETDGMVEVKDLSVRDFKILESADLIIAPISTVSTTLEQIVNCSKLNDDQKVEGEWVVCLRKSKVL